MNWEIQSTFVSDSRLAIEQIDYYAVQPGMLLTRLNQRVRVLISRVGYLAKNVGYDQRRAPEAPVSRRNAYETGSAYEDTCSYSNTKRVQVLSGKLH